MITLLVWSQRTDSQSLKVGRYLSGLLDAKAVPNTMVELSDHSLPWYDDEHNPDVSPSLRDWYAQLLNQSDAFVIISPERWGMASPALKNFFLRCKKWEMAHKPALLVGVSSGGGWAYPIAELRMSSYKNTKICYLPDHLIIRHVKQVLNELSPTDEDDRRIRTRIDKTIDVLLAYRKAFSTMRSEDCIAVDTMPNGM